MKQISNAINIPAQNIRYHINELMQQELVEKIGSKYVLSEVFYLGNGEVIIEKILNSCTEVLEMGLENDSVCDKSLMLDVLKMIFSIATTIMDEK